MEDTLETLGLVDGFTGVGVAGESQMLSTTLQALTLAVDGAVAQVAVPNVFSAFGTASVSPSITPDVQASSVESSMIWSPSQSSLAPVIHDALDGNGGGEVGLLGLMTML